MSDSLQIEQGGGGECSQLRLIGRLDALGADRLEQEIEACLRQGAASIVLQLAEVPYLGSAGIRTLLRTVKAVRARGGSLRLLHPSAVVQETLRLVGLIELLAPPSPSPLAPAREWVESSGLRYRVEMLEGGAPLRVERVGDPEVWPPRSVVSIPFPADCFGFGLGALGGEEDALGRVGECLAAGGAAISLPTGDSTRPDYLIAQGELVPELSLAYGLLCRGRFSHWTSFEAVEKGGSVAHAQLAELALELSGASRVGMIVAGEIAGLVGAALLAQASGERSSLFSFPAVREQLRFTPEPAHAGRVGLAVGVVARQAGDIASFLRPLQEGSPIMSHFHCAVFPYQALSSQESLIETVVAGLLGAGRVEDLLHLVEDTRPLVGAGGSRWLRGSLWFAQLEEAP